MTLLLILLLSMSCLTVHADRRQRERSLLTSLLSQENYDPRTRPVGANGTGPTLVRTNMMVREIKAISDLDMEMDIQVTLRLEWHDPSLKFSEDGIRYLTLTDASLVWTPDAFFKNERKSHLHNVMKPNNYIRVFPDGSVLYSNRISLSLACEMDLSSYPFDAPICDLTLASYAWTTEDLVYLWKDNGPIQISRSPHVPKFSLQRFSTDTCDSKTNTGSYSCLRVDFVFSRDSSIYIFRFFLPSVIFVVLSFFSFWLDASCDLGSRILLILTSLLGLLGLAWWVGCSVDRVSYSKAIDVWMGMCVSVAFAALLETMVVYCCSQRGRREKVDSEEAPLPDAPKPPRLTRRLVVGFIFGNSRIDAVSRVLFPTIFLVFNIGYWSAYSGTQEESDF